jgi:hypothetical protein
VDVHTEHFASSSYLNAGEAALVGDGISASRREGICGCVGESAETQKFRCLETPTGRVSQRRLEANHLHSRLVLSNSMTIVEYRDLKPCDLMQVLLCADRSQEDSIENRQLAEHVFSPKLQVDNLEIWTGQPETSPSFYLALAFSNEIGLR